MAIKAGQAVVTLNLPTTLYTGVPIEVISAQEGDKNSRVFKVKLYDERGYIDITHYKSVKLSAETPEGDIIVASGEINPDGYAICELSPDMMSASRKLSCNVIFIDDDATLTSRGFYVEVSKTSGVNSDITEDKSYNVLVQLLKSVDDTIDNINNTVEGVEDNIKDWAVDIFEKKADAFDGDYDSLYNLPNLELKADLVDGHISPTQLPKFIDEHVNDKLNPHGVTKKQIGLDNLTNDEQAKKSDLGVTIATLENSVIPEKQLPSFIKNVLEYDSRFSFPNIGESGKIYIDKNTNKLYRWKDAYIELSESLSLGVMAKNAFRGDYGHIAYTHSQEHGNAHGMNKSDINLGNVDNTSDVDKPVSTAVRNITSIKSGVEKSSNGGARYYTYVKDIDPKTIMTDVEIISGEVNSISLTVALSLLLSAPLNPNFATVDLFDKLVANPALLSLTMSSGSESDKTLYGFYGIHYEITDTKITIKAQSGLYYIIITLVKNGNMVSNNYEKVLIGDDSGSGSSGSSGGSGLIKSGRTSIHMEGMDIGVLYEYTGEIDPKETLIWYDVGGDLPYALPLPIALWFFLGSESLDIRTGDEVNYELISALKHYNILSLRAEGFFWSNIFDLSFSTVENMFFISAVLRVIAGELEQDDIMSSLLMFELDDEEETAMVEHAVIKSLGGGSSGGNSSLFESEGYADLPDIGSALVSNKHEKETLANFDAGDFILSGRVAPLMLVFLDDSVPTQLVDIIFENGVKSMFVSVNMGGGEYINFGCDDISYSKNSQGQRSITLAGTTVPDDDLYLYTIKILLSDNYDGTTAVLTDMIGGNGGGGSSGSADGWNIVDWRTEATHWGLFKSRGNYGRAVQLELMSIHQDSYVKLAIALRAPDDGEWSVRIIEAHNASGLGDRLVIGKIFYEKEGVWNVPGVVIYDDNGRSLYNNGIAWRVSTPQELVIVNDSESGNAGKLTEVYNISNTN